MNVSKNLIVDDSPKEPVGIISRQLYLDPQTRGDIFTGRLETRTTRVTILCYAIKIALLSRYPKHLFRLMHLPYYHRKMRVIQCE